MPQKGSEKGTPLDWHTVAGGLRNGDKREATTQEMTLRNCRGTFTEPTGQPSGKQGTRTVTGEEGEEGAEGVGGWGVAVRGGSVGRLGVKAELNAEVCGKM